uniref:Gp147.1 n=1 Tax=Caviid herpesvirus 2 str. CIDMTR TaxID=1415526 RepID=U6HC85_9BETA|nr:gp147.1 [Caviid herpesvirus 2 str. CIDMTR]
MWFWLVLLTLALERNTAFYVSLSRDFRLAMYVTYNSTWMSAPAIVLHLSDEPAIRVDVDSTSGQVVGTPVAHWLHVNLTRFYTASIQSYVSAFINDTRFIASGNASYRNDTESSGPDTFQLSVGCTMPSAFDSRWSAHWSYGDRYSIRQECNATLPATLAAPCGNDSHSVLSASNDSDSERFTEILKSDLVTSFIRHECYRTVAEGQKHDERSWKLIDFHMRTKIYMRTIKDTNTADNVSTLCCIVVGTAIIRPHVGWYTLSDSAYHPGPRQERLPSDNGTYLDKGCVNVTTAVDPKNYQCSYHYTASFVEESYALSMMSVANHSLNTTRFMSPPLRDTEERENGTTHRNVGFFCGLLLALLLMVCAFVARQRRVGASKGTPTVRFAGKTEDDRVYLV